MLTAQPTSPPPVADAERVAVVGAGAAGLAAAYLAQQRARVSLFECDTRLGGHAHTFVVPDGPDAGLPLDVGFMVLNDRNYPLLHALFRRLADVEVAPS